jgi:uncharacterized membrane protein
MAIHAMVDLSNDFCVGYLYTGAVRAGTLVFTSMVPSAS